MVMVPNCVCVFRGLYAFLYSHFLFIPGHEFPFAIKMNHVREASLTDEDGFPFDFDQQLPSMDPLSPETQCQFILKRNRKIPNRISIGEAGEKGREQQGARAGMVRVNHGASLFKKETGNRLPLE